MPWHLALLAGAYLIGSVPFSFMVARAFGVADVRRVGSGNVGATNVMRSAGKAAGLLALLLDACKGAAAALVVSSLAPTSSVLPALAALGAVIGHMYPPWLGFQGGKGVATGAGAFLLLAPYATLLAVGAFALVVAMTRYVSVGSMVGAVALAAATLILGSPPPVAWAATGAAALVIWRHRGNIVRLAQGREGRLGAPAR
ncbi:MAG TPA: glycerol-3-phosphate 1-O-acyltransferase PlsY [Vicinamibacteria bacterium]|jgi:glycerol-3-phosphate acyltransferase PlsY|nr:glycerol-3-phosphate 1-O-acyltransferase PlsY [Vicinamibacteria bacterium]